MGQVRRKLSEPDAGELGEIESLNPDLHPQQRGLAGNEGNFTKRSRIPTPKPFPTAQPFSFDPLPRPVDLLARFRQARRQANKRSPSSRPAWKGRARWGRGWGGRTKGLFTESLED